MAVWFIKADSGGVLDANGQPATDLPRRLLDRFQSWVAEYSHLQNIGPALQDHAQNGEILARALKRVRPNDTVIYFNIILAIADDLDEYAGQTITYVYEITSQTGKT